MIFFSGELIGIEYLYGQTGQILEVPTAQDDSEELEVAIVDEDVEAEQAADLTVPSLMDDTASLPAVDADLTLPSVMDDAILPAVDSLDSSPIDPSSPGPVTQLRNTTTDVTDALTDDVDITPPAEPDVCTIS